jgi:hypothetical protein
MGGHSRSFEEGIGGIGLRRRAAIAEFAAGCLPSQHIFAQLGNDDLGSGVKPETNLVPGVSRSQDVLGLLG